MSFFGSLLFGVVHRVLWVCPCCNPLPSRAASIAQTHWARYTWPLHTRAAILAHQTVEMGPIMPNSIPLREDLGDRSLSFPQMQGTRWKPPVKEMSTIVKWVFVRFEESGHWASKTP